MLELYTLVATKGRNSMLELYTLVATKGRNCTL
jgi:hypothetical protein